MFVLAIGVAIGIALSLTGALDVPADRFANAADNVIVHSGTRILDALPAHFEQNRLVPALIALLAVAAPGLLSWALACGAGASVVLRRILASVALIAGVGCYFVLPAHEALILSGGLALFAMLVRVATSLVLAVPLVAASVALGVRQVVRVIHNDAQGLTAATRTLDDLSHVDSQVWHVVAIVVALAPLAATAVRLMRLPRVMK